MDLIYRYGPEVYNLFKKLLSLSLAAAMIFGAAGCSAKNENKKPVQTLKITYYNGKYGDEWIKALTADFKKKNKDINVVLTGDNLIDSKIGYSLMSGAEQPDLIFVSKTNWQIWADSGYMENLNGLYTTVVDGGKTFADKLQPDLTGYSRYQGNYRIVPWGDGVAGIIYNKKMFEQNGWAVPTTTAKLSQLIDTIKNDHIIPFAWSGQNGGYWDNAVTDWWMQYEGADNISTYLKMASPEVYKQSGRLTALKTFQSIVTISPNSIDNPTGIDAQKAIDEFYKGNAAMMPGGYLTLMETKNKVPSGFGISIMKLPAISDAKQPNVSNTLAGDFAFVPSKAKNGGIAKKFLLYMASDSALSLFSQKTGVPAPFVYDMTSVKGMDALAKSEAELWQSTEKCYMYSDNPNYYNRFLDWPFEGSPLMEIYSGRQTAQQALDRNYEYVQSHWNSPR